MPAVYCDQCARPLGPDSAFYTDSGSALCDEHKPPECVVVEVEGADLLCPRCGRVLKADLSIYVAGAPTFYVGKDGAYLGERVDIDSDASKDVAYELERLCCTSCGWSVSLDETEIRIEEIAGGDSPASERVGQTTSTG
jgi:hypothetical protein